MPDYIFKDQYGVITAEEASELHSPKTIRFITPEYEELFRIPNGGQILLCYPNGEKVARVCKYLDDYHVLVGQNAYHICEFAERVRSAGARVTPFPEKRVIWSDVNLDIKDWIRDLRENNPGLDEAAYGQLMYETNAEYLNDERRNLDIPVGGSVLVIADLGLWHGRCSGYREIHDAKLSDCLAYLYDAAEWYVTRDGEFQSQQIHHDGTNYYTYRKYEPEASEEEIDRLKNLLYENKDARAEIDRLTQKLGGEVGKVYGWEFPTEPSRQSAERDTR